MAPRGLVPVMPESPVLHDSIPPLDRPRPCWNDARNNPGRWVETDLSPSSVGKLRKRYRTEGFDIEPRQGTVYVRWNRKAKAGAR